jgi:tRNA nucleotidyltransferase/poly(A) polymerase
MNLENFSLNLDKDAIKVIRRLHRNKFLSYIVGGSIRDLLLDRLPKDFDLVTNATPYEIRKLFRNSRIIGRRFKLVHVYFGNDKILETSTFRAAPVHEGEEEDLLIVTDNQFGTPEEDALRRDFTINGLFYDVINDKIIDYVDGLTDIENRLIRTIGDPDVRFQEDPVRIIRALRFASKLNFDIEENTYKYLKIHKENLKLSSRRRVIDEVWKTLMGGSVSNTLPLMMESGVMDVLIPELANTLKNPQSLELMKESLKMIDLLHLHPMMSHSFIAPLFFQFQIGEILSSDRIKGNVVTNIYKERLQPLLIEYGYSRLQRDEIHKIMHIIAQLGHPSNRGGKIPSRIKRKDLFHVGYFCWQILWHSRGELSQFDLSPLFDYKEKKEKLIKEKPKKRFRKRIKKDEN